MKRIGIIGVVLCLFLIAVTTEVKAENNGSSPGEKFINGISNIALGGTEIIAQPIREVSEGSPVERVFGFLGGFIPGAGKAVARVVGGAANLLSAPFPTDSVIDTYPIVDDHL